MAMHPVLNFPVTAKDKFVICVYNKSHQVLTDRLCRHLVKCRTAYLRDCERARKKPDIIICRWNSNHHLREGEMRNHELECPDRECMTEHMRYHESADFKAPGPAPGSQVPKPEPRRRLAANFPQPLDAGEDWEPNEQEGTSRRVNDREPVGVAGARQFEQNSRPQVGYDPQIRLSREPIIQNPQGLTRSERREFREEERVRWAALQLRQEVFGTRRAGGQSEPGGEEVDPSPETDEDPGDRMATPSDDFVPLPFTGTRK